MQISLPFAVGFVKISEVPLRPLDLPTSKNLQEYKYQGVISIFHDNNY
jgi:hypothetical protein